MKSILIIGGGEMGQSLAKVLHSNGAKILIWDIDPNKTTTTEPVADSAQSANFIFYCAPATSLRATLEHINPSCPVIVLAKGLETSTGSTTDQVLAEMLEATPFGILGGPMLAEELNLGTTAVLATSSPQLFSQIQQLFKGTPVSLEYTDDYRGVALLGALKNIYTLLIGMACELTGSCNRKGVLISQILTEMEWLSADLGGKIETATGLAGLADLIATSSGPKSANYTAGVELARFGKLSTSSEGLASVGPLCKLLGSDLRHYPLLQTIARAVNAEEDSHKVLLELIGHPGL